MFLVGLVLYSPVLIIVGHGNGACLTLQGAQLIAVVDVLDMVGHVLHLRDILGDSVILGTFVVLVLFGAIGTWRLLAVLGVFAILGALHVLIGIGVLGVLVVHGALAILGTTGALVVLGILVVLGALGVLGVLGMRHKAIGAIPGLCQAGSQGNLAKGASSGSIVSTSGVGGNVHGDTLTMVWASEVRHSGDRASQCDDAEAEEVCKLHDVGSG